ncbi:M1 family metallopeptidase [Clostridium sp. D2Q-11]|uniref:M1 family metallopeptidase n=2 Tax=Anaeromonas frigoriresistens TaxID=2683708 RepID=A0A942UX29_9FIRM|nr:M1 family metallopeptidase [Anaeromonas frigoriresistens]
MVETEEEKDFGTLIIDDYNDVSLNEINEYNIEVSFNPDEKTYNGKQLVKYINNEEIDLENIYFHIYPNTFRQKDTAPFLFDSFESAYPEGFSPGYIDIESIKISGKKINYKILGKGNTVLRLDLENKLEQGEKIDIEMQYTVKLPSAQDRFGYGDKTYNFGNWYPVAAVYDGDGWNLDPYYSIGDPFYSDVGNYNVTINAPKEIEIASSGNILSEKVKGENKIWKIESKLMRDFAWVASEYFEKIVKNHDGTTVKLYFLDDVKDSVKRAAMDYSVNSIKHYNNIYGKYPYGQYSVVQTSFPSGMEYPGIVYIGDKYYTDSTLGTLEIIITHETAHQWWYGLVGNNQIDEAWLDESLATYSEFLYATEQYDEDTAEDYYERSIKNNYEYSKDSIEDNTVIRSLDKFVGWEDYGPLVYAKGAMMIYDIQNQYGKETLYSILQQYFDEYRFKNATTSDFIKVVEDVTGNNIEDTVDKWLYDN